MLLLNSADALRIATPTEGKTFSRDESMNETDPQILRSSNSINKPSQASILLRGAESLHEMKRKRELRNAMVGELENNNSGPTTLVEKKRRPSELGKLRKIDPAKAFGRLNRTTKVVATQKVLTHSRNNKEQQAGVIKEKDRIKLWTR